MHPRRLIGTLISTALVAASAAVITAAAPASAVTATSIVGSDGEPWLQASSYRSQPGAPRVGDTLSLSINVVDASGAQVYDGTITVERQLPGSAAWTPVATAASAYLYDSVKAVGNATYRVIYSGYGDYAPASTAAAISIQRKLEVTPKSGRKLGLAGKVAPKGKVKLTVLKKHGKKWKKFKSARTDKRGKFFVRLPAPGKRGAKLFWKVQIKASSKFATTQSGVYYTTKY